MLLIFGSIPLFVGLILGYVVFKVCEKGFKISFIILFAVAILTIIVVASSPTVAEYRMGFALFNVGLGLAVIMAEKGLSAQKSG